MKYRLKFFTLENEFACNSVYFVIIYAFGTNAKFKILFLFSQVSEGWIFKFLFRRMQVSVLLLFFMFLPQLFLILLIRIIYI